MLALKGESAIEEVDAHRPAVLRAGGGDPIVRLCGEGLLDPPTTVVEIPRVVRTSAGRSDAGRRQRRR